MLATLLAHALALGQRNDFALFSALGAAMVVGGSLGEDLESSLNRVRGTLAGTAVGIAVAYLLGASIWSLALGVAAVAWLCIGLDWGAPAMRIGLAMTLVVLAFHGTDPAHYALWRAFNTLIGVVVGLVVRARSSGAQGSSWVCSTISSRSTRRCRRWASFVGRATARPAGLRGDRARRQVDDHRAPHR